LLGVTNGAAAETNKSLLDPTFPTHLDRKSDDHCMIENLEVQYEEHPPPMIPVRPSNNKK
jgi:hypothetical protein